MKVMSYLRVQSITGLLYKDDRLLEEYNGNVPEALDDKISRSYLLVKLTVKLLVSLGFFLGTKKCVFILSQRMVFLVMIIDSVECWFFITEKRRQKFFVIQDLILQNEIVPLVLVNVYFKGNGNTCRKAVYFLLQ